MESNKQLRPYQSKGISDVLSAWGYTKRVLLVMPTGTGKSFTAFSLIDYLLSKDCYVIFVVRKRNLVTQLIKEADAFNLNYGVNMANDIRYNAEASLQICSIDTLISRRHYPHISKDKVFLFVDEADESLSQGYEDFRAAYPNAQELGLTATPYNGLYIYDKYVRPITEKEAFAQGYLKPLKIIVPKEHIDPTKLKVTLGEFDTDEVNKATSVTDIVNGWEAYGDNRPTLVFSSNVKTSKEVATEFCKRGIIFIHLDANTSEENRDLAIKAFKSGAIKGLCNVGLYRRGTDIPLISCIIDNSPTTKINLYRQKGGRGTRTNNIYKDCIYIDYAANCTIHGDFEEELPIDLSEQIKTIRANLTIAMKVCNKCFRAFKPTEICPYCGTNCKDPPKTIKAKNLSGEFVEMTPEQFTKIKIIKKRKQLYWQYFNKGLDKKESCRGWVEGKLLEQFGLEDCKKVAKELKLKKWHVYVWARKYDRGFVKPENLGGLT